MSQESANSKALHAFKFDENVFRQFSTNPTKVEPSLRSNGGFKYFGKSVTAESGTLTPKANKIESSTQMTPGFADYCIGKTISFIDGGGDNDDESPVRNADIKSQILQSLSLETTFSSPMQVSDTIFLTSDRHQTPNDQLCKSFSKINASSTENKRLTNKMTCSGDVEDDDEYMQTRSRVSKVSFKRKYKPLQTPFRHEDSLISLRQNNNITEDFDSEEKHSEKDFEQILTVENYVPNDKNDLTLKDACDVGKYSYYALFFMVMSNLIGFGLSLTFQVLLILKRNADRFLNKSWIHWKNAGIFQRENNLLALCLLIPIVIVVGLAYAIIWTCFGINKFLLTEVPDRVDQLISFKIRIFLK